MMTGKSSSMAVICLKAINNKHLGLPDLHPILIICGSSTVDSPRIILGLINMNLDYIIFMIYL